jgi:hypothetical protein
MRADDRAAPDRCQRQAGNLFVKEIMQVVELTRLS